MSARPISKRLPLPRRVLLLGASTGLGLGFFGAVAACGAKPETTPSAAPTPTADAVTTPPAAPSPAASPTPSPTARDDENTPSDIAWTSGHSESESSGSCGIEVDVRAGKHEGYDRIVVETSEPGTLGWYADFVPAASTQGRGDPISVGGSYILRVFGRGTRMTVMNEAEAKTLEQLPRSVALNGNGIVDAVFDGTFESQFQLVIGTLTQDYRIFTLADPSRLVIDVRNS